MRRVILTVGLMGVLVMSVPAGAEDRDVVAMLERKVTFGEEIDSEEVYQAISETAKSDAEKTFRSYLADPVPESISELKGDSLHWLGFKATLTFHSDPEAFQFLSKGYNPIGIGEIPDEAKDWFEEDITIIEGLVCFHRNDELNDYYLFWDERTGRVFFKGREE